MLGRIMLDIEEILRRIKAIELVTCMLCERFQLNEMHHTR
jgi:hypothetical protein